MAASSAIFSAYRVSPVYSVRGNDPFASHLSTDCRLTVQATAAAIGPPADSIAMEIAFIG